MARCRPTRRIASLRYLHVYHDLTCAGYRQIKLATQRGRRPPAAARPKHALAGDGRNAAQGHLRTLCAAMASRLAGRARRFPRAPRRPQSMTRRLQIKVF